MTRRKFHLGRRSLLVQRQIGQAAPALDKEMRDALTSGLAL
jgi:hypothetical protein